jgi:hypothetical protein
MAAARLSIADIAHRYPPFPPPFPTPLADLLRLDLRVTVSGLAALSVYGMYGMWRTHTETMAAGEIAWAKHLVRLPSLPSPPFSSLELTCCSHTAGGGSAQGQGESRPATQGLRRPARSTPVLIPPPLFLLSSLPPFASQPLPFVHRCIVAQLFCIHSLPLSFRSLELKVK